MKTVIIGSGLSGLIYAFYNPNSTIIMGKEDSKKASFSNPFVFIQKNIWTERLLKDLGITVNSEMVNIELKDKGGIIRDKVDGACENFIEGTDRIANVGRGNMLEVFNVSGYELRHFLLNIIVKRGVTKIIYKSVIKIYNGFVFLSDSTKVDYSKLISTVNFKIFERLCSYWKNKLPIKMKDLFCEIKDYDGAENKIDYTGSELAVKIVYNSIARKMAIEYRSDCKFKIKDCRFVGSISPSPENIYFLGRFATANNHWRIEDSIVCSINSQFYEMLEDQKRYDSAIKDKSGISGEKRIKELALCLYSKVGEVLKEINWRVDRKEESKKVNMTSVIQECVDIFKYCFAILGEYDQYTLREFIESFYKRDNDNWDKFLNNFYGGV